MHERMNKPGTLPTGEPRSLSQSEELISSITHGVGLALSIVGGIILVAFTAVQGEVWRVVGCSVYAAALVAVYAASTLSHSFGHPKLRRFFRMLDQGLIYLLIVATYTPFALAYLRNGWGWMLLILMWSIALFGFLSKVFFGHRVESVSIWLYLWLGWMPIITATPLSRVVPAHALWWMLVGGLCYTLGTLFLIFDEKVAHFHTVWHLCVIAGSTCHFLVILLVVAPLG